MKRTTFKSYGSLVLLLAAGLIFILGCGRESAPSAYLKASTEVSMPVVSKATPWSVPPEPVGGFEAIQSRLKYPESALESGKEGLAIIGGSVDVDGRLTDLNVIASFDNREFVEAAFEALEGIQWRPARMGEKPVKVQIRLQFAFRLEGAKTHRVDEILEKTRAFGSSQAYDEPPVPVGGFEAIQRILKYPEEAREAGVGGRVIVHVLIDENGQVVDTKVLDNTGPEGMGLAEAATKALRNVKWQPAHKNGQPIKVWVAVPVVFRLHETNRAK